MNKTVILSLSAVFAFAGMSAAMDTAEREFVWNEANAMMHAAQTSNDYLRAATTYQKLTDAGIRNGILFYNYGIALLGAGRYDNAVDALLRAERYLGHRPEIIHNLRIAMAKRAGQTSVDWPWYRAILYWHYYFSGPARATIAAWAFCAFWLALTIRRLGLRRGTQALAGAAFLVFVMFGSSLATSWHQETTAQRYSLQNPLPASTAALIALRADFVLVGRFRRNRRDWTAARSAIAPYPEIQFPISLN